MCKEGAGILHSIALSVWHTKIPQRTSQARGGTDLQTMFSAQPAEFHSLGALRTQRKQPWTMLRSPQGKSHSSRLLGVRWSCQAEGAGHWSKGEKWGTMWLTWEGRRCSKARGRDRLGRLGDEKVGAEIGISTMSCRKWGNRASFLARTDAQPDINPFLSRTEVMAMPYCSRHCSTCSLF